jgi:hypothetical protein
MQHHVLSSDDRDRLPTDFAGTPPTSEFYSTFSRTIAPAGMIAPEPAPITETNDRSAFAARESQRGESDKNK